MHEYSGQSYLDLPSTQNNGRYPRRTGLRAIDLGTLEVQVSGRARAAGAAQAVSCLDCQWELWQPDVSKVLDPPSSSASNNLENCMKNHEGLFEIPAGCS